MFPAVDDGPVPILNRSHTSSSTFSSSLLKVPSKSRGVTKTLGSLCDKPHLISPSPRCMLTGKAEVDSEILGIRYIMPTSANCESSILCHVQSIFFLSKMASKNANDYDYRLVDDETGLQDAISELKRKIAERNTLLAVDCEGDSLSRKGALTIITVATEEKVYIFDVLKLGQLVFSSGLGEILEDKSRQKLTFDCRQDSDALWHQFKVKLSGVLDLQLLEVIYRRENPTGSTANTSQFSTTNRRGGRRSRRSQRTDEVEKIYGFGRCIELYLQDEKLIKIKDKGKQLLKKDEKVWTKRPLTDDLIQYCVVDTMAMFRLYNNMKDVNGGEQARLRVASEKYVDLYRGKTQRSFDNYEMNSYLPLDVIPDKGTLYFPAANTTCTRCHRRFPREAFSTMQLRNGAQKCRVCKEINRREDIQQNREDWWERGAAWVLSLW